MVKGVQEMEPYFEQNKNQSGLTDIERPFYVGCQTTELEGYHISPHWHYHMEIIYMAYGEASITVGSRVYEAQEDDFILIHPCEVHSVIVNKGKPSRHFVIGLDPELLIPLPKLAFQLSYSLPYATSVNLYTKVITPTKQDASMLHLLIEEMQMEYHTKSSGFELAVTAAIYRLVLFLFRHPQGLQLLTESPSMDDSSKMEAFRSVLIYLNDHCHRNITAEEIAKISMMSYSRFAAFFKRVMHTSFTQYLMFLRIRKAEQLLLDPTKSITQIALEAGFNHVSYFIKNFKRIKGISPKLYRNQVLLISR
jgi:AraC-like DNA-binding protein